MSNDWKKTNIKDSRTWLIRIKYDKPIDLYSLLYKEVHNDIKLKTADFNTMSVQCWTTLNHYSVDASGLMWEWVAWGRWHRMSTAHREICIQRQMSLIVFGGREDSTKGERQTTAAANFPRKLPYISLSSAVINGARALIVFIRSWFAGKSDCSECPRRPRDPIIRRDFRQLLIEN